MDHSKDEAKEKQGSMTFKNFKLRNASRYLLLSTILLSACNQPNSRATTAKSAIEQAAQPQLDPITAQELDTKRKQAEADIANQDPEKQARAQAILAGIETDRQKAATEAARVASQEKIELSKQATDLQKAKYNADSAKDQFNQQQADSQLEGFAKIAEAGGKVMEGSGKMLESIGRFRKYSADAENADDLLAIQKDDAAARRAQGNAQALAAINNSNANETRAEADMVRALASMNPGERQALVDRARVETEEANDTISRATAEIAKFENQKKAIDAALGSGKDALMNAEARTRLLEIGFNSGDFESQTQDTIVTIDGITTTKRITEYWLSDQGKQRASELASNLQTQIESQQQAKTSAEATIRQWLPVIVSAGRLDPRGGDHQNEGPSGSRGDRVVQADLMCSGTNPDMACSSFTALVDDALTGLKNCANDPVGQGQAKCEGYFSDLHSISTTLANAQSVQDVRSFFATHEFKALSKTQINFDPTTPIENFRITGGVLANQVRDFRAGWDASVNNASNPGQPFGFRAANYRSLVDSITENQIVASVGELNGTGTVTYALRQGSDLHAAPRSTNEGGRSDCAADFIGPRLPGCP